MGDRMRLFLVNSACAGRCFAVEQLIAILVRSNFSKGMGFQRILASVPESAKAAGPVTAKTRARPPSLLRHPPRAG